MNISNRSLYRAFLATLTTRSLVWDISIFAAYFLTAKIAQYILLDLHTSPALIWAPTGIALAAVLLKGYRMWVPIALAFFLAVISLPGYLNFPATLIATIGFTIQPLFGAWLFSQFNYDGTIHRTRDVVILVLGAFVIAAIGPLFNALGQVMLQTLRENAWVMFSRSWTGCVLSIIIVTPFITGWYYSPSFPIWRRQLPELICAFGLLLAAVVSLFWSSMEVPYIFIPIFVLCITLFWISFRFGSRINTTAVLFLAIIGITGSIIANPSGFPLNQQLFIDELFFILIVPIFALFFTQSEERRLAEQELAAKVQELERITEQLSINDRSKNEFIAILAHELRNPLSTLVSTMEVLQLESMGSEAVGMIDQGQQQAQAMRRLLDDLLDVARIAEKKFKVIKEFVDLDTIIQQSVRAIQYSMNERNHTLLVSIPEERVILWVDPIRIMQVMTNLLNNASRYTPPGGMITLTCVIKDKCLRIDLRDNGQGIPPEHLERIFAPFQQLQPAPHRTSGIGVGLFLSRQIIEMHGGTIEASSEGERRGSCFTVMLPLSKVSPPPVRVPRASIRPPLRRTSRIKVLIVDDNEAAATGMCKLLAHRGYEVEVAYTGQRALHSYKGYQPEVVLLDIGLPDISGYEVARHIRLESRDPLKPFLVAVTGYGQSEDKADALAAGFNYHLTKPVSVTELDEVIQLATVRT
jgi:signal transduction histidine kinase/CheY-like chemotaxis protein